MTWKRKAYQVAAALNGQVSQWWPMSQQTFASVVVQTDDGLFHGRYSKCYYLSLGNDISSTYPGAMDITVGKDGEGTDRFEVVYNQPLRKDTIRILTAFVRLNHPDFNLAQVLAALPISSHERLEWMLELTSRD